MASNKGEKCDLDNQINERVFSLMMDVNRYKNLSNCRQDTIGINRGITSILMYANKFYGVFFVAEDLVSAESELLNLNRPIDSKYIPPCIPQISEGELYDKGIFSSNNMKENAEKCKDGIPCDCTRDSKLNLITPPSCKKQLPNRFEHVIRPPAGCEPNIKEMLNNQSVDIDGDEHHDEDHHDEDHHDEDHHDEDDHDEDDDE